MFDRIHCSFDRFIGEFGRFIGKIGRLEIHCSNFESNGFRPIFTEFGRFFRKPVGSEGADFLNTAKHTPKCENNFFITFQIKLQQKPKRTSSDLLQETKHT
jgi:hypothetical protein